jgi:prepilin-type N-terminal cleavage/methylation domain-containing protein
MSNTRDTEKGFTLLEMLLTVTVLGSALLLVSNILQQSARGAFYKSNAGYMDSIMDVALDYVDDVTNFNIIYSQIDAAPVTVMEVPIYATAGVVNPLGFALESGAATLQPHPGISGSGVSDTSPFKQNVTVLYRNITAVPTEPAIEVVVALLGPIPERDLREAAQALGAGGAYISTIDIGGCLPAGCAATVQDAFGGNNNVQTNVYAGTRLLAALGATPPSAANGGYLLYRRTVTLNEIAGDYLYRTPQLANPQLNRMETDLDLANNNIVGVDNMAVSGAGGLNVLSDLHAQGSVFTTGAMQVQGGDLSVVGDVAVQGDIDMTPGYDTAQPNINVPPQSVSVGRTYTSAGNLNAAQDVRVANTAAVNGDLQSASIQGENINVGGTLDVAIAGGGAPNGIFTQNLTAQGDVTVNDVTRAGNLVTDQPLAINGNLGALEVLTEDIAVGGDLDTQIINMNGPASISNLKECNIGC